MFGWTIFLESEETSSTNSESSDAGGTALNAGTSTSTSETNDVPVSNAACSEGPHFLESEVDEETMEMEREIFALPDLAGNSDDDDDLVETDVSTVDLNADNSVGETNQRRKKPAPEFWKRNMTKRLRLQGEQYTSLKDVHKNKRKLGTSCNSSHCKKSSLRTCDSFTEEHRQQIFGEFWRMDSWEERKTYVKVNVDKVDKNQSTTRDDTSRQEQTFHYHLPLLGKREPVCRNMFCSTLGMAGKTVNNWLRETAFKEPVSTNKLCKTPKSGPSQPVSEEDRNTLKNWLMAIPTVPSHYCRKISSYQDKKFIWSGKSIAQLHRDYLVHCTDTNQRKIGIKFFTEIFKEQKMSFFKPRKDLCNLCVSARLGNLSKEKYDVHVLKKDMAREQKDLDKMNNDNKSVWTMDLQCVLLCPKSQASAMYYKTKLIVHNMTYYNLKTHEGFCYVFDETNGNLSSSMFSYLHYSHFYKYLSSHPDIKELIIWSDGCGYQNKCSAISNAFLQLALETNVSIEQKFLEPGHTNMECDSMHSTIERRLHVDIFCPRDYALIMKAARIEHGPYQVKEILFGEVRKLSSDFVKSVRPGKRAGDATVSDVCAYRYCNSSHGPKILYKLIWTDEWNELPERMTTNRRTWEPLFQSRIPLTKRKFDDLQSIKSVIPSDLHNFYDSLPHL